MRSYEHEPDPVTMCNLCCQDYVEGTRHQCFLEIWVAINRLKASPPQREEHKSAIDENVQNEIIQQVLQTQTQVDKLQQEVDMLKTRMLVMRQEQPEFLKPANQPKTAKEILEQLRQQ